MINDPRYWQLLQRHFRVTHLTAQYEHIIEVCRRHHPTYHELIDACTPLLETPKGLFAASANAVVFLSRHGDVFPASTSVQGIPAAMFRSHAFIDRTDILSNPESFLQDAALAFPQIRDWASHTKDAKNNIKMTYSIPYLDDF